MNKTNSILQNNGVCAKLDFFIVISKKLKQVMCFGKMMKGITT